MVLLLGLSTALFAALAGPGHAQADPWVVGLIAVSAMGRIALVGLIGCLVLGLLVRHRSAEPAVAALLQSASRWALLWCAAPIVTLLAEIWSPAAAAAHGDRGPDASDVAARMRWLVVSAGLALLVHLLAGAARTRRDTVVVLGIVAAAAWVGTGLGHGGSVLTPTAVGVVTIVHVLAASTWAGGLLALVTHRDGWVGPAGAGVVRAYSRLALLAFCALAASGLLGLALRVSWSQLHDGGHYIAVVGAKAAVLVLLALLGAQQRRVLLARLDRGERGPFLALAAGELVLMGIATGLAVALAHSPG